MPYLLNCWYAAAASAEVSSQPMRRTLLDMPVVFYRGEDGQAHALFRPLPAPVRTTLAGRVIGDELECGYHGLRFDAAGACIHNPHGDGAIPRERQGARLSDH